MARWENEDVSDLDLPDPTQVKKTYFDKNGKITTDDKLTFAIAVDVDEKDSYYIKYSRGEIVDPHHVDYNFKNKNYTVFKKVCKEAFDMYHKFLQTKNRLYFTRARRYLMERI
jgi:hypothetical protein